MQQLTSTCWLLSFFQWCAFYAKYVSMETYLEGTLKKLLTFVFSFFIFWLAFFQFFLSFFQWFIFLFGLSFFPHNSGTKTRQRWGFKGVEVPLFFFLTLSGLFTEVLVFVPIWMSTSDIRWTVFCWPAYPWPQSRGYLYKWW